MNKAEKDAEKAKIKAEKDAEKAALATEETSDEFVTEDPEILKPKTLPLVVKPTSGAWANEEQEAYSKILNAYAYKNPKKWMKKKAVLLAQLSEIGKDPEKLMFYKGVNEIDQKLNYKDNRISQ